MGRIGGIGGHTRPYKGQTNDWITPKYIPESLGKFDLDPCSSVTQPWKNAEHNYTIEDDGFKKPLFGRVWLNPPYGPDTVHWLKKLADHGNGIAIIFARTETQMFFEQVWERANSVFFFRGRLYFYYPDGTKAKGNAGGPSCLVAYGENNTQAIKNSGLEGILIDLRGNHV